MEGEIAVLIGFGLVVVLPIVAILTAHQRKMTELLHKNHASGSSDELLRRLDAIQSQLDDMQDRQNSLILQRHEQSPPLSPRLEERIQE